MLTIFFLIALSIFVPPFWVVTIGYIIYLLATKKQRRNKVIMNEVMQSIALNREQVILDYLYFDSAKNFAVEHGALLSSHTAVPAEDILVVELNIDGKDYQITLQRWENNETRLLVCAAENAKPDQKSLSDAQVLLLKDSA